MGGAELEAVVAEAHGWNGSRKMPDSRVTEMSRGLKNVTAQQVAEATDALFKARDEWKALEEKEAFARRERCSAENWMIEARRKLDALIEALGRELPREAR